MTVINEMSMNLYFFFYSQASGLICKILINVYD